MHWCVRSNTWKMEYTYISQWFMHPMFRKCSGVQIQFKVIWHFKDDIGVKTLKPQPSFKWRFRSADGKDSSRTNSIIREYISMMILHYSGDWVNHHVSAHPPLNKILVSSPSQQFSSSGPLSRFGYSHRQFCPSVASLLGPLHVLKAGKWLPFSLYCM